MPPPMNVFVGVAAYVETVAGVLLRQRGGHGDFASDGYGCWGLPGGWLEFGEQPYDAARREVEEETGALVRPVSDAGFVTGTSDNGRFHIVTLVIKCEFIGGLVWNAEPDKSLAVKWFAREMLVELDLFAPLDRWWKTPYATEAFNK
jgi:8-oxo-dGTP diphosphatase